MHPRAAKLRLRRRLSRQHPGRRHELKTGIGHQRVAPVYNLVPAAGTPAQFGFIALIPPVYITAEVRPDGGLTVTIPNNSQALPLTGTS